MGILDYVRNLRNPILELFMPHESRIDSVLESILDNAARYARIQTKTGLIIEVELRHWDSNGGYFFKGDSLSGGGTYFNPKDLRSVKKLF